MVAGSSAQVRPDQFDPGDGQPPGARAGFQPPRIEFRQLRYFVGVAEELHFGRAAARLYVTQPGLSQAIARLERELDVRLFIRTQGKVELTEAGTELLWRARRLLADVDETVTQVRLRERGDAGLVRVGVALLAEPLVAPAITAFQDEHPNVVLDRSAMVSERLLAQLHEGRIDVAVVHQIPALASAQGMSWEPLRRSRLALLAAPGSGLAIRHEVPLSELSGETFLVNPSSLAPRALNGFKAMCREFGDFEPIILESTTASTAGMDTNWHAIENGIAVMMMAEATARSVHPASLAVVPLRSPPEHLLALAWRDDRPSATARLFLHFLRSFRDQHSWDAEPGGHRRRWGAFFGTLMGQ